jgi:hypothetical protein
MKLRHLASLATLALALLVGSGANATMIAGWDFSQYFDVGALSTDGGTFTATLDANYADAPLDPTFGAGAESAAFGTMYMDGANGSTDVTPLLGSGLEPFQPTASTGGSLVSNLTEPGGVDFDSHTILIAEGQLFANSLAMIASAAVSVVFGADLTSVPLIGSNWSLSFGARTFQGNSNLVVEFSTDGVTYAPAGPAVALNSIDTRYVVNLGAATSDNAYVRLTFNPSGANQPILDNVAIHADLAVPEPSTALLGSLGLVGLLFAGRRRVARD